MPNGIRARKFPVGVNAAPNWSFNGNNGVGVVSLDGSYHFFNKKKIEPYVVGGYSPYYGDRTDTQNGFNIGGGMNLWVAKHAALRLEVRDQNHIRYFHSPFTRFVAFRGRYDVQVEPAAKKTAKRASALRSANNGHCPVCRNDSSGNGIKCLRTGVRCGLER